MVKMAQFEPSALRWGMLEGSCSMVKGVNIFESYSNRSIGI